jgi:hypothetical protein
VNVEEVRRKTESPYIGRVNFEQMFAAYRHANLTYNFQGRGWSPSNAVTSISVATVVRKHANHAAALITPPLKLPVKQTTNKCLLIILLALCDNEPLGFN